MDALREFEARTGRKLAGLRANTRDELDRMLLTTLAGTGIGRSSFILAAIDEVVSMDADRLEAFKQRAMQHEARLSVECPWGQGL